MKQPRSSRAAKHIIHFVFGCALLSTGGFAVADLLQDRLFERVVAGANCKQTLNNGIVCEYEVGKKLSFSIKDAGGNDTVIGFGYSNINEEFYAVYYFNCIVVVPGFAHARNYDSNYGVYVSPINGHVYRTRKECEAAKK